MSEDSDQNAVGVLGATSSVGASLLPLLIDARCPVTAFSRQCVQFPQNEVVWQQLTSKEQHYLLSVRQVIPLWICAAPIWVLPEYFSLLEQYGARRVVVVSSTSRFTKDDSSDNEEQLVAHKLADAEARVREWAESRGVEWVILRPTLIYGLGRDKNISEIARFIHRFGIFPVFGQAMGLRQPIHTKDVAAACLAALHAPAAVNHDYNIAGGETLTYRAMVTRVFFAVSRRPRLLTVPLWVFRLAVAMLRCLPRYRKWTAAMAERMNSDLVFDYADASRDFGFKPNLFVLNNQDDLPPKKRTPRCYQKNKNCN